MKKLNNRRGETIAETLVALLISAIGMVLLASMIQSASRMIANSQEQVKLYMSEENRLVDQPTADDGTHIEADATGIVTIKSVSDTNTIGTPLKLTDGSEPTIEVDYYVNQHALGSDVKKYEMITYKEYEPAIIPGDPEGGGESGGEGGD
jgi:hypothetical protein